MTTAAWRGTGDLEALLDRARALALVRAAGLAVDAVEVSYLKAKPGQSAIVGYTLLARGPAGLPVPLPGYVRTFSDGAAAAFAKWHAHRPRQTALGSGVRMLPGGRSILCLFPNDAELRSLGRIADARGLCRALSDLVAGPGERVRRSRSSVQTIRYKPERRWVARADLVVAGAGGDRRAAFFVRLFPDGRGSVIARHTAALRDAGMDGHVPRPLGSLLDGTLYVEEAVPGVGLLPLILRGDARAASAADVLRRLHSVAPLGKDALSPIRAIESGRRLAEALAAADPALDVPAHRALAAVERLGAREAEESVLHGDLHLGQVVIGEKDAVLVDLERAGRGDPLLDVGNLVADTLALAVDRPAAAPRLHAFVAEFLRRYPSRSPVDLSSHVVRGLMEAALLPWRRQEAGWPARAAAILDLADAVAKGSVVPAPPRTSWQVLYPGPRETWPGRDEEGRPVLFTPETGTLRPADPANDPGLPALARWLPRGELVAYRPGRRAVVRVASTYAKILPASKARRLVERHRRLEAAIGDGVALPQLLGEQDGAVLFAEARGRPLHEALMRDEADHLIVAVARAIACLHAVAPGGVGLEERAEDEIQASLGAVARAGDGALREYAETAATLGEPPPRGSRPATLHGDLHDKNVVVDGARVCLLDLDGLRAGDPAEEIGNLVAHLVLRALQRDRLAASAYPLAEKLLEAYAETPPPGVRAWTARALFRLACIYKFRRQWSDVAPALLREVVRWVG